MERTLFEYSIIFGPPLSFLVFLFFIFISPEIYKFYKNKKGERMKRLSRIKNQAAEYDRLRDEEFRELGWTGKY